MKKFASYIIFTMLIACIVCACNDSMDIRSDYGYSIETLPLQQKIKQGETVMIEFTIVRDDYYADNYYQFRYFQSQGKGKLFDGEGRQCDMNCLYLIPSDEFRMFYQSDVKDSHKLDFTFIDSFGNKVEYSITLQNEGAEEGT